MSNLSVNNRSGSFPSLFGPHVFDDFVQNVASHFPFAREALSTGEGKLDFVNPKVDITENKKAYTLTAELPGLDNDDITLDLSDGILTLSGQKKYENEADTDDNVHVMERKMRLKLSLKKDCLRLNCQNQLKLKSYNAKSKFQIND